MRERRRIRGDVNAALNPLIREGVIAAFDTKQDSAYALAGNCGCSSYPEALRTRLLQNAPSRRPYKIFQTRSPSG